MKRLIIGVLIGLAVGSCVRTSRAEGLELVPAGGPCGWEQIPAGCTGIEVRIPVVDSRPSTWADWLQISPGDEETVWCPAVYTYCEGGHIDGRPGGFFRGTTSNGLVRLTVYRQSTNAYWVGALEVFVTPTGQQSPMWVGWPDYWVFFTGAACGAPGVYADPPGPFSDGDKNPLSCNTYASYTYGPEVVTWCGGLLIDPLGYLMAEGIDASEVGMESLPDPSVWGDPDAMTALPAKDSFRDKFNRLFRRIFPTIPGTITEFSIDFMYPVPCGSASGGTECTFDGGFEVDWEYSQWYIVPPEDGSELYASVNTFRRLFRVLCEFLIYWKFIAAIWAALREVL